MQPLSLNRQLLEAVPSSAQRVLDIGCGTGELGKALLDADAARFVCGIDKDLKQLAQAKQVLSHTICCDVEQDAFPNDMGQFDLIICHNILEQLLNPEALLRRLHPLLHPHGFVLISVANVQHHQLFASILTGDWQYQDAGLLDRTHLRFFSYSTAVKLVLDAGFLPSISGVTPLHSTPQLRQLIEPLWQYFGIHPNRGHLYLDTYQYILKATPTPVASESISTVQPLTFSVCISDHAQFSNNFLASPDLQGQHPHQIICWEKAPNAAEGHNRTLAEANFDPVICVHQDVYLPRGWIAQMTQAWNNAQKQNRPIGCGGVYGVRLLPERVQHVGCVVDREQLLNQPGTYPGAVDTLDELLLIIPRKTHLSFDPYLGWHFYGADFCQQVIQQGQEALAFYLPVYHNSKSTTLNPDFFESGRYFAQKWQSKLPVATTCTIVDAKWLPQPNTLHNRLG